MTQVEDDKGELSPKLALKFMWQTVDESLLRKLLIAVYDEGGQKADAKKVRNLESGRLVAQATATLGRPLNRRHMPVLAPLLRDLWLPTVGRAHLDAIAGIVQLGLAGKDRTLEFKSKGELIEFFARRRMTDTFLINLRWAFVNAHKDLVEVSGNGNGGGGRDTSSIVLSGAGATDRRKPFDHQVVAWGRLDEMKHSRKPSERSGLLVLPTGAGKTYTMVAWLTRQLEMDPSLRVLWIADQQELVDQASRAFRDHAQTMPAGVSRVLRVIHGGGSPVASLADDDVDVVCATRQSLIGTGFAEPAKRRFAAFFSRPCIVVVDEAHHAVSPTYRNMLDFVLETAPPTLLIGLTATPWPKGADMTALLRRRFRVHVADVQTRDLVKSGVLAKPQLHTVLTGETVVLTDEEAGQIAGRDVPASVLRALDRESRNELIVDTWVNSRQKWGKTLVFACDIAHADRLGHLFGKAGVTNTVIHSRSESDRSTVIQEFRDTRAEAVLISVGMLLEGVDVPDARTAFLTRPTSSRIVLRQMIGRVLRGVAGGGEDIANIVDLRDRWSADVDVLSPVDIVEIPIEPHGGEGQEHRLPPVLDEVTLESLPGDVLRRIERAYADVRATFPCSSALISTRLVGFYELGDLNVPIFDHARSRWEEVVASEVAGPGYLHPIEMFDDLPVPQPVPTDIRAVVEFCRSQGVAPPLVQAQTTLSIGAVAREIREAGPLTEDERMARLHSSYESTIARSAFASFQTFLDAVQQELLALSGVIRLVSNPESVEHRKASGSTLPALGRRPSRELQPLFSSAAQRGREILGETAPELEILLQPAYLPPAKWTRSPLKGAWAFWHPRLHGKSRGKPMIRVNCALQTPRTQISDELLEYLLWHELVHHVLPGRGHDAEFRRLEALWPNFAKLDHELDSIHERFDLP